MNDNIIDISRYIQVYLQVKDSTKVNRNELDKIFKKLFSKKYNTVCIDIDKTVTDGEYIADDMINLILEILKQNKNISFITGRGRQISKSILNDIYSQATTRGIDIKNITCCTGNGAIYMYSKNGFLDKEESIISKDRIEKYQKQRELLRDLYIKELEKNKILNVNTDIIKKRSIESSGKLSLRFPIDMKELGENTDILQQFDETLLKMDLTDEYFASRSIFNDKIIFEISLANKKMAIDFLANRLEEKTSNIIRIGDQGKKNGNDFEMLNCFQGFSVDEIEPKTSGVLPIMGSDKKRVTGIDATKKVIEDLIIEK